MRFAIDNKIIEKPLHYFYGERTFEIPKRSGERNYFTPFNMLKNWDLVMTLALYKYNFTFNYIHLIEQEQFDEH